jgi:hypothetical protein
MLIEGCHEECITKYLILIRTDHCTRGSYYTQQQSVVCIPTKILYSVLASTDVYLEFLLVIIVGTPYVTGGSVDRIPVGA